MLLNIGTTISTRYRHWTLNVNLRIEYNNIIIDAFYKTYLCREQSIWFRFRYIIGKFLQNLLCVTSQIVFFSFLSITVYVEDDKKFLPRPVLFISLETKATSLPLMLYIYFWLVVYCEWITTQEHIPTIILIF